MIPKIIHYCWFGRGKMPEDAQRYIASWKKYCQDYIIKEWNEDTFDLNINSYVKEAYLCKKYAFVTDFVRLYALYHEGGIYMDTDVEVLKPLDEFLRYEAFSGFEEIDLIPTGIMAAEKSNIWVKQELEYYETAHFIITKGRFNLTTNVLLMTEHAKGHGFIPNGKLQTLDNGLTIFPKSYFCPKSPHDVEIKIEPCTHTIHHFSGSWAKEDKILSKLKMKLGAIWGTRTWKMRNLMIRAFSDLLIKKYR